MTHTMTKTMTKLSKSALVLGVGLVLLPGCPLLDIEADVEEVCLTYPNLQVPGAPAQSSIQQSFVFDDLSAVHDLTELDADLQFVRAEVKVTSGASSLAFVDAVKLKVSSGDPNSKLPPMTMYDCDGDCAPAGDTLVIPAAVASNAIEYLRGDSVVIDIDFQGEIPQTDWSMDVSVCMKARASYTFSP